MLNISINLETGVARLAQTTTIKAGGGVPVTLTFTSNPGADPVIELALSPQSSSPSVKAYLDEWESQNSTVYTGTLDANDTRLIELMEGKQATTLDCEIVVTTLARGRIPFPNFPISVQPPVLTGPESSEGGPLYLTQSLGDARYLQTAEAFSEIADAGESAQEDARENIGAANAATVAHKVEEAEAGDIATLAAGGDLESSGRKFNDAGSTTDDIWSGARIKEYLAIAQDRANYKVAIAGIENDPAEDPEIGARYLVGDEPTGAWIGHEDAIAEWTGDEWEFEPAANGDVTFHLTEEVEYVFTGVWESRPGTEDHNNHANIQGGSTGERYHLTEAQRDSVPTPDQKAGLNAATAPITAENYVLTAEDIAELEATNFYLLAGL